MPQILIEASWYAAISDDPRNTYDDALTASHLVLSASFFSAVAPAYANKSCFEEPFLDLMLKSPTFVWVPNVHLKGMPGDTVTTDKVMHILMRQRYMRGISLRELHQLDPPPIVELIAHSTTLETFTIQKSNFKCEHFFEILRTAHHTDIKARALDHMHIFCFAAAWTESQEARDACGLSLVRLNVLNYLVQHVFAAKTAHLRDEGEKLFLAAAKVASAILRRSDGTDDLPALRRLLCDHVPFLLQHCVASLNAAAVTIVGAAVSGLAVSATEPEEKFSILFYESNAISIAIAMLEEHVVVLEKNNSRSSGARSMETLTARLTDGAKDFFKLFGNISKREHEATLPIVDKLFRLALRLVEALWQLAVDDETVKNKKEHHDGVWETMLEDVHRSRLLSLLGDSWLWISSVTAQIRYKSLFASHYAKLCSLALSCAQHSLAASTDLDLVSQTDSQTDFNLLLPHFNADEKIVGAMTAADAIGAARARQARRNALGRIAGTSLATVALYHAYGGARNRMQLRNLTDASDAARLHAQALQFRADGGMALLIEFMRQTDEERRKAAMAYSAARALREAARAAAEAAKDEAALKNISLAEASDTLDARPQIGNVGGTSSGYLIYMVQRAEEILLERVIKAAAAATLYDAERPLQDLPEPFVDETVSAALEKYASVSNGPTRVYSTWITARNQNLTVQSMRRGLLESAAKKKLMASMFA